MILLITIIAFLNAFFATAAEFNLFSSPGLKNSLKKRLLYISLSIPLFAVVYFLQSVYVLLLVLGLFFLVLSFIYLGIINFKPVLQFQPLVLHSFFISIIIAMSGLNILEAVFIFLFYLFFLIAFSFLAYKMTGIIKNQENVNELLELFQVINGIFFFVLGLVIAVDRIRFLEKIANWLF